MRNGTFAFDEEQIGEMVACYAASRDIGVRNHIVLQLTPLVESLARRYTTYTEPLDDLVSEGFIGLISALEHFDPGRGVKFSTYASHFVVGQIKHYLRDRGKIIREPAWLQEVSRRISGAVDELRQELCRQPTSEEIGARVNLAPEAVDEILACRQVFQTVPIDAGDSDDDDSFSGVNADKIKSLHYVSLCLPIEDRIVLDRFMSRLRDLERRAIDLFFYQDLSQTEIARKMDISCNYAGHLIRTGLQKLKRSIQSEELREAHLTASRPGERKAVVVDRATSLYSATYFHTRLNEEITRARYYGRSLAVVVVRLQLPESLGLAERDDLLAECGGAIRQCLRRADVPARTGVAEFGAILPHTSYQAHVVAERLAELAHRIAGLPVTWGAAIWPPQGAAAEDLWQAAQGSLRPHQPVALPASQRPGNEVAPQHRDADNGKRMTGERAGDRRRPGRPRTRPL